MGILYKFGVIITILGLAGIAEAITGRGSILISGAVLAVGFGMLVNDFIS